MCVFEEVSEFAGVSDDCLGWVISWGLCLRGEGIRAVHVYPAFRHRARHGAVLPPIAPKKATLF